MRVIFLDIDGVMNCADTTERCNGYVGIDPTLLNNLKQVIDATAAVIVLTSTWKDDWVPIKQKQTNHCGRYLNAMFSLFDMEILDKTEDDWIHRGQGILNWLAKHDVESFIMIDDDTFDYEQTGLMDYLIHTSWSSGFTSDMISKAIFMLTKEQ